MLRLWPLLPLVLIGLAGPPARADLFLTTPAPSRSVTAEVTYTGGNVQQSGTSTGGGSYMMSVAEGQSGSGSSISNAAMQNSTAPPDMGTTPSLSGSGNVTQTESYSGNPGFTDGAFASSDYTVNFNVDQTGVYLLTGTLSLNLASPTTDIGSSSISLNDSQVGIAFPYQHTQNTSGTTTFSDVVVLTTLDSYTLTVLADIGRLQGAGPSSGTSTAGWTFSLTPLTAVPEPSSLLLVALGGASVLIHRRRRKPPVAA